VFFARQIQFVSAPKTGALAARDSKLALFDNYFFPNLVRAMYEVRAKVG
jgi:hypothetical protein